MYVCMVFGDEDVATEASDDAVDVEWNEDKNIIFPFPYLHIGTWKESKKGYFEMGNGGKIRWW